MPLDPSIPLRAGRNRLSQSDPMDQTYKALRIAQAQQQMAQGQQAQQYQQEQRNALAQISQLPPERRDEALQQFALQSGDLGEYRAGRKEARISRVAELEMAQRKVGFLGQLLGGVQDQNSYQEALMRASQEGLPVDGAPPTFDPAWVRARMQETLTAKQQIDRQFEMAQFEEKQRATGVSERQRSQQIGISAGQLGVARQRAATSAARGGMRMTVDPKTGAVSFEQGMPIGGAPGTAPLEKIVRKEAQKKIMTGSTALANTTRIKTLYDPSFLTYEGKARNYWSAIKSKAGGRLGSLSRQERETTNQAARFRSGVEQAFNQYRKEITGAAASVQELDRLKTSMFNTDQSPVEFEAMLDEFERTVKRGVRIAQIVQRRGIAVTDPEFGRQHDALFAAGADDDVQVRGDELAAQGLSVNQVATQLLQEGYLQ